MTEQSVTERVEQFLQVNFPQIQMHGGSADVREFNEDSGEIVIRLGGACDGCGISGATIEAINQRLIQSVPEINKVDVDEVDAEQPTVGPF